MSVAAAARWLVLKRARVVDGLLPAYPVAQLPAEPVPELMDARPQDAAGTELQAVAWVVYELVPA